jgi:MFS family permease
VQSGLHAAVNQLQWVVNGYALTFAGLMLSFGTIGDLFGRKKVTLTGVGVFCAGSVIAAVAATTDILIAGRVVMGHRRRRIGTRHPFDDPSSVPGQG